MINLTVDKLKEGMTLAEPVTTRLGQVIAPAKTILSRQLIAKFSFYKISQVSVNEAVVEEPKPKKEAAPLIKAAAAKTVDYTNDKTTYTQRLMSSPKFQQFQSDYALNISYLKENFEAIIAGGGSECQDLLLENCESLFKSKTSLELFDMLHNMRTVGDAVYAHSLNVALISRAIGKWLQLNKADLDILTLAGLLHDIGKTQIPEDILNKPGKYTPEEWELVKSHTLAGNKLLYNKGFNSRIPLAALQHHERADGSGYPRGLAGDEIDDFASIIAIADVYDGMTCTRSYKDPLCSFQVIYEFEKEGLKKYKAKYILTFLQRYASIYNNSRAILNDATSGRVVYINNNNLSRPILQLDDGSMLDLSAPENKNRYITNVL